MKWQPIETAPAVTFPEMIVVIAIDADVGASFPYTSDPYCVWRDADGKFVRWPHPFPPTHYCTLPTSEDIDNG